ncbi:hypothetical protein QR680_015874 [Steinernema hermaphroditum]|uniref:F-box domain-containing protein n=1 Tax=Steinernema hermaphroditum TaxID=289476 RepID=A0AA39H9J5_9BILA|nr:hypothetical protein QR680_015874 [Steinernema hermaphroditum]
MGAKLSCLNDNQSIFLQDGDGFSTLPVELKWKIASFLSVEDGLLRMRLVCSLWNEWIIAYLSTKRMSVRLHVDYDMPPKFAIDGGKPNKLKIMKKIPSFYHITKLNTFEKYASWKPIEGAWNEVIQFMSLPPCQNLTSIAIPSIPTGEHLTYFCERLRRLPDLQYVRLLAANDNGFMNIHDELIAKDTLRSIKFHLPYGNQLALSDPIFNMFAANPHLHTLLITGHGTYSNDLVEKLVSSLIENPRKMNIVLPVRPWVAHNLPGSLRSVQCTQIGDAYYHMMPDALYTLKITSTPAMTHVISGHYQIEMKRSSDFDEFKTMLIDRVIQTAESMDNANAKRRIATEVAAHYRELKGLVYDVKLDAIKLKRDMSLVKMDPSALQRLLNSYFQTIFHRNVHIIVHIIRNVNFALS